LKITSTKRRFYSSSGVDLKGPYDCSGYPSSVYAKASVLSSDIKELVVSCGVELKTDVKGLDVSCGATMDSGGPCVPAGLSVETDVKRLILLPSAVKVPAASTLVSIFLSDKCSGKGVMFGTMAGVYLSSEGFIRNAYLLNFSMYNCKLLSAVWNCMAMI
jgi:hypothetical protein